ncbi:hypothetical protein ColTof4_10888 [Colletotrichum tofieldiae]|nr:hypothetical protein ColTof3_07005 [Colletotrichum tofieldiae]GKT78465.1 hypothetical protein ColTof4_10888 [Colletotrichum tofieldiae]GKT85828.1 hypothetical protein Ct61P_03678 [Colletotrichum tofieldiae]
MTSSSPVGSRIVLRDVYGNDEIEVVDKAVPVGGILRWSARSTEDIEPLLTPEFDGINVEVPFICLIPSVSEAVITDLVDASEPLPTLDDSLSVPSEDESGIEV